MITMIKNDNSHSSDSKLLTDLNAVLASQIWSMASNMRSVYRPSEYHRVMLPLTILACFDLILSPYAEQMKKLYDANEAILKDSTNSHDLFSMLIDKELGMHRKQPLYNVSGYSLSTLVAEPEDIVKNLTCYIDGFSAEAYDIFDHFNFREEVQKLAKNKLLYKLISDLVTKINVLDVDVQSLALPLLEQNLAEAFESIVLRLSEQSNETVGEYSTPHDVANLMTGVTFELDLEVLEQTKGNLKVYDPVVGMGTILSRADNYLRDLNPNISTELFGEDINGEAYAICCANMIIRDQPVDNIINGNALNNDGSKKDHSFDYMFAHPPYGYNWKLSNPFIEDELSEGMKGRFGAGLPRTSDGSFLFLQHMISKMNPSPEEVGDGSRIAVIFNGSPLFAGGTGSGESNIRRWVIESDWLEAVIALPDQLYYNTGINTYIWVLSNKKPVERKGKIQLIDATEHYQKLRRRDFGTKRKEISSKHIEELVRMYASFNDGETSQLVTDGTGKPKMCSTILNNQDFSHIKLVVERPLRLNFIVNDERMARLDNERAFARLIKNKSSNSSSDSDTEAESKAGIKQQLEIKKALKTIDSNKVFKNKDEFEKVLSPVLNQLNFKVSSAVKKAIINALSEKDPSAEACMDSQGNIEADSDLRDYEQIPLLSEIQLPLALGYQDDTGHEEFVEMIKPYSEQYLRDKVLPYAPDAWIDYDRTRIGYEISFNRYFFVDDSQPRDIKAIEAEIAELEARVNQIFNRVQ